MGYVTRIAPSPTGDFHMGTARTAYFNWLAARASGGRFILRIDDTDLARNTEDSVNVIYDSMQALGLDYDMTFRQSDNFKHYKAIAEDLIAAGKAQRIEGGAIALKNGKAMRWRDNLIGDMVPSQDDLDRVSNQVLIRSDGTPVYHFASAVDDIDTGVNLVIRGSDHISNTFRQTAIYEALDGALPEYAHLGLIFRNGRKMSKRDGVTGIPAFLAEGYRPDALLNFMLRLGWGPKQDDKSTAILPVDRALDLFLTGGKMRAAPASFDQAKLDSFNRKYAAMEQRRSVEAPSP